LTQQIGLDIREHPTRLGSSPHQFKEVLKAGYRRVKVARMERLEEVRDPFGVAGLERQSLDPTVGFHVGPKRTGLVGVDTDRRPGGRAVPPARFAALVFVRNICVLAPGKRPRPTAAKRRCPTAACRSLAYSLCPHSPRVSVQGQGQGGRIGWRRPAESCHPNPARRRPWMRTLVLRDSGGEETEIGRGEPEAAAESPAAEVARLEAETETEAQHAYLEAEISRLKAGSEMKETEMRRAQPLTLVGQTMPLLEVPTFSRIRIKDWGSIEETGEPLAASVDDVLVLWTDCESPENAFATVEVRGVIDRHFGLVWLPDDATIEVVAGPQFAGQPEDLVKHARPVPAPEGSKGDLKTAEGWPPLIWNCDPIYSPVQGWSDPELSVEVILCALNVAPDAPNLHPMLLAALKARYAKVTKDPRTYPPERYPWRGTLFPDARLLEYLRG
jgi:hypothetical protein